MSDATSTMARGDDADEIRTDAAFLLVWAPPWKTMARGFRISGHAHTVGREPGVGGFAIPHAAASRLHAVVQRDGDKFRIKDLGSRNGTFVNGEKISSTELSHGDDVRIGDALFIFVAHEGEQHLRFGLDGKTATGIDGVVGGWSVGKIARDIEAAANGDLTILVRGETGVGKELFARALHAAFARKGPMIAVNCAALSPTLLESELFGHEKGAFTGADRSRDGLARAAHGGTLFLDEIGDLGLDAQAKLLRVLETREVMPVGSTRAFPIDVRVVCATHRDLPSMIREARFRADLYARIAGATIFIPSLRDRKEDLFLLVNHFLERASSHSTVTFPFMNDIVRHSWPFNVRELANAVLRAASVANHGELKGSHLVLESHLPQATADASGERLALSTRKKGPSKEQLAELLDAHAGNVAAVARALGRDPAQVYRWLKQYGVDPNGYRK